MARQWFTPEGILALLPLDGPQGHSVAVVWSIARELADGWLAADTQDFTSRLEAISQGALGRLELSAPRMAGPLQQAVADYLTGSRGVSCEAASGVATSGVAASGVAASGDARARSRGRARWVIRRGL